MKIIIKLFTLLIGILILNLPVIDNEKNNEILVTIDGSNFTQQDFQYIQQLSEIIQDSGEIGEFELNNLKLDITDLTTFEKKLIVCE